jgi:hypothetical protein
MWTACGSVVADTEREPDELVLPSLLIWVWKKKVAVVGMERVEVKEREME